MMRNLPGACSGVRCPGHGRCLRGSAASEDCPASAKEHSGPRAWPSSGPADSSRVGSEKSRRLKVDQGPWPVVKIRVANFLCNTQKRGKIYQISYLVYFPFGILYGYLKYVT
jgi:hypothetical protein